MEKEAFCFSTIVALQLKLLNYSYTAQNAAPLNLTIVTYLAKRKKTVETLLRVYFNYVCFLLCAPVLKAVVVPSNLSCIRHNPYLYRNYESYGSYSPLRSLLTVAASSPNSSHKVHKKKEIRARMRDRTSIFLHNSPSASTISPQPLYFS